MSYAYSTEDRPSPRPIAQYVAISRAQHLTSPSLRIQVEHARAEMKAIENLDEGWDGYGADQISPRVRRNAWHVLNTFLASGLIPEVSPDTNGTVSFEWDVNGIASHLQVGRSRFSMYIRPVDDDTEYFDGEIKDFGRVQVAALANALSDKNRFDQPVTAIDYSTKRSFAFQ